LATIHAFPHQQDLWKNPSKEAEMSAKIVSFAAAAMLACMSTAALPQDSMTEITEMQGQQTGMEAPATTGAAPRDDEAIKEVPATTGAAPRDDEAIKETPATTGAAPQDDEARTPARPSDADR
jgi:hypothetical protein